MKEPVQALERGGRRLVESRPGGERHRRDWKRVLEPSRIELKPRSPLSEAQRAEAPRPRMAVEDDIEREDRHEGRASGTEPRVNCWAHWRRPRRRGIGGFSNAFRVVGSRTGKSASSSPSSPSANTTRTNASIEP